MPDAELETSSQKILPALGQVSKTVKPKKNNP